MFRNFRIGVLVVLAAVCVVAIASPATAQNSYCTLRLSANGACNVDPANGGTIYLANANNAMNFDVAFFQASFSRVRLHYSALDANGRWTSTTSRDITLVNGQPGDYYMKYGTVALSGFTAGRKYAFVIEVPGAGTWFKTNVAQISNTAPTSVRFFLSATDPSYRDGNFTFVQAPAVTVNYPGSGTIITSSNYTYQIGANASTNNVRIKIDGGDWRNCVLRNGVWCYDWSGYTSRAYVYSVEGWNGLGQRVEQGPYTVTVQLNGAPSVNIEYPPQNSSVSLPYSVNMVANVHTNNVRVRFDGGSWRQCTYSGGRWWCPITLGAGSHSVVAEAWNAQGGRFETAERVFSVR